jgi:glycosyltransferase involved in cell wall biosynthesis
VPYRILDFINTDSAARELLDYRVAETNRDPRFVNDICCGDGDNVAWLRGRGHAVHVLDVPRGYSPFAIVTSVVEAAHLLRRERYDVVHLHGCLVGVIGRIAAVLARTPHVVYQAHGYHHHDHMPPVTRWFFITAERVLSPLAEKHLFQAATDVDETLKERIAPGEKLVVVGNGIQLERFKTDRAPETDPPVVLYVARMEAVKNHPMLFRAARLLRDRGVAFKIRLVGDGELRGAYERLVASQGLSGHVEFLGYRTDVPELIARSSVCVLTSWLEGVPRAIIEAGAVGRPVVATDVVGTRSILEDGATGYLVPYDDAQALADRLAQLLTDEPMRRRMGERAREKALRDYDERVVVDRIKRVYAEVLETRFT